jgi:signal transduction histidine kinase/CheY-like chemotaxis protein
MVIPPYDDIPIGVCVIKRDRQDLGVLYANPALTSALGTPAFKTLEELWPGTEMGELAKRLRAPVPPRTATLPYIHHGTGVKRWALLNIDETTHDSQDTLTLWATDISASKEAESRLQEAVASADAAAHQKSNFLATMSHEIRTPMQSVYGLLELIEAAKPPADILTMARTAKGSASGLLEILDDILDFAKMDADQMDLDLFEVPVRTLARGIIEALAVKVHGKKVDLKDDIAPDVPFVIVGDPKRLRQIIMNLMGNAMKFTSEGSVTIRITRDIQAIPLPKSGVGLRFEIIDTGLGMSPEVAGRLFQPFVQADNSTARKFGGTGLGLSICKKLVEKMGGQIGVLSEAGVGSTFWFEIPTQEVDINAQVLNMPVLDGISVISVEDHPQGAKEIVKSLRSMGATIESVPTYGEALDLIKRRPFDVAVIDQGLPDGLGLDLIRDVMEIRPFMGLIMYTVRDDKGLQHSLQSMGVTYLTKPASRVGLGEAVQDAATKAHKIEISGPTKLVIAEDTAAVRDVLSRQLKTLGVEATFVENGLQALEAVRSGAYGILFTDLHMPEMDGYGLVKKIREDDELLGRHFPIIALTADVQMSQRQVYMFHGFDECLLKPVSLGHFRRLLVRWGLLKEQAVSPTLASPILPTALPMRSIDHEAIIAQMGGFDENTLEMLQMFVEMTAPLIEQLQDAAQNNRQHDLKEIAHSLKGAARSACANILGDLAAQLQDDAEAGNGTNAQVAEIASAFQAVTEEIKNLTA